MDSYNSEHDTKMHIKTVEKYLCEFVGLILERATLHDKSKLLPPEKEVFDEVTPLLKELTYGSKEYNESLENMKSALKHHYSENRHHPEHFENGIEGMNLVDLIEMICDWKAASERHNDGNVYKSLDINRSRFAIDDQLFLILENTVNDILISKKAE